jgi:hypothetical protein
VTDNYAETFRYDANGNILQLNRNGHSQQAGGVAMDRLTYTYRSGTNQFRLRGSSAIGGNPAVHTRRIFKNLLESKSGVDGKADHFYQ